VTGARLLADMEEAAAKPRRLPLYRQVAAILFSRIAGGLWKPKSLLPSEGRIADELGVSAGTVRKALDHLSAEGLVQRRQGVGTFVTSAGDPSRLLRFFRIADTDRSYVLPDTREMSREISVATSVERRVLDLSRGERVLRIKRIRSVGGRAMMVEKISLPSARFGSLMQESGDLPATLYDLYEARFGVTIRMVSEQVRAICADAEAAAELQLESGTPVLEVDRHAFTFGAKPIEWRICRLDCRGFGYLNVIE
jgi:GntR family transcriptional regulator